MLQSGSDKSIPPAPSIMQSAPLFPVALGLIVGLIADANLTLPIAGYLVLLVAATVIVLRFRAPKLGPTLIVAASFGVGGLLHTCFVRMVPANAIERLTTVDKRIVHVRGRVDSQPRLTQGDESEFAAWAYSGDRTSFLIRVDSVEGEHSWAPVTGRVQVFVREAVLDLHEGEHVELRGWLEPLRAPRNPGAFDWAAYLHRQGVGAGLTINHREAIRRMETDEARPSPAWLQSFRQRVRLMLTNDLSPGSDQQRSLLEAMVIGHRSRVDRKLNETFIKAGCVHFLAVSGVHVLIVMFIARAACAIVSLVRILVGAPALRSATRTWMLLIAVVLYMLVAEPRPPILRSGILAIVYCLARLLGRESARLNWISLAVIILSIINSNMVFDIGFQLSTIAVLGVCYLAPAIDDAIRLAIRRIRPQHPGAADLVREDLREPNESRSDFQLARKLDLNWRRLTNMVKQAVFVSMAAWIVTLPIVAHHFGRVHPWGVLNSLLILPVVSIVMALGFAKLIAATVSQTIAGWLTGPLETVDSWLIDGVEQLSQLPGASIDWVAPPAYVTLTFYAALLAFVIQMRHGAHRSLAAFVLPTGSPHREPSRLPGWVVIATAGILLLAVGAWRVRSTTGGALTVTTLAVGAGSATVVELPDGQAILYDAGSMANPNVGRRVVVPFLRSRGIRRIDRAYLSHPNVDHINGLPGVIEQIPTGPVMINEFFERLSGPRSPSRHLLKLLDDAHHDVQVLDSGVREWHYGGATFELLWPTRTSGDDLPTNDSSTVLRISYAGRSILLTGDIEQQAQSALLNRGDLRADVLILPHHGGVVTNTQAFIDAVDPDVLVRSSHQSLGETANGLPNITGDRRLLNTADHGAVTIRIDEHGIRTTPIIIPYDD